MGCDYSFTHSLEFSNFTPSKISSFHDVNNLPDEEFQLHFDKVKILCESKKCLKAQEIGDQFFSKHAIVQAISIYQHVIESDPKYGLQQLQGLGSHEMAMSYYEEHVWKFYDTQSKKSIYDALSLCYMILTYSPNEHLNLLSRGQAWYKKMIEKESNNIGLLIGCGNFYYNIDDFNLALEYYEKSQEIYDGMINVHVMKAFTYKIKKSERQKSIEQSKKILQMTKDNQYAELILVTYIENIKERIKKLEQLHQKYPEYNRILTEQGADYSDLDSNTVKGIQCYEKAIKANPMFYKAYNNIGLCYRELSDYNKSLEFAFKAIQMNRHFLPTYDGLLITIEKSDMKDQNIKDQLKKYPNIKKDWFWMKLAQALETRKPKQTQKIISYYQMAIEQNPKCYISLWLLGRFYESRSMDDKSIQHYKKSFQANPEFYRAYYNLALLYTSLGYQDQAIRMYQKTIEINPRYPIAYHNLADIYLSRQDQEKAEHYFENAVKFEPTNSIFFLNSGVCYFKQNKYKLARESFFNARKYLYKAKTDYGKQKAEQIEKNLKNADIDNDEKWNILYKSATITQDQKDRLKKIQNQFAQKLKRHQKINTQIKMPLEKIMNPDLFQIIKQIYDCHFGIVGLPKTFKYVMKLFCQVDEDYFHIVPLFVVQFFLRSIYEFKVDPQTVEKDCLKYMKEVAAMVAQKQKQVNQSTADGKKENQQESVNLKNIKIELNQCKALNKQINIFKDAAYFDSYEDLYAEIDKTNNAAKPSYSDFALLVEQVRTKAKGLPGGISMKIPSKSQDQFKVIMRIMQKMFKKEIDADRIHKTIYSIYAKIVISNYDETKINEQIIDAWNQQITKILIERKQKNIQTQCFVSDLIRAKCIFNTVEDLANAVKVADSYCKMQGYQIVELDNRLAKPQTKDVVLKVQIRDAVCEFQLAMPQSAKLFHLDHCVYEIIRSPLGCVFGSFLFISKEVKYPLAKNCEDMFIELSKSKDMMDKINKMYPQYVRNALTKQWTILGRRKN